MVLFFKEKLTSIKIIALILALTGCILTADPSTAFGAGAGFSLLGIGLVLASAFSNSWYSVLAGWFGRDVPGLVVAAYSLPVTALCFTSFTFLTGNFAVGTNITGWIICLSIGLLTALAVVLFIVGILKIGASRATILATAEPATAVILGVIFLAEPLSLVKFLGGLAIIAAIFLLNRYRSN